eukprot:CAMPEP_0114165470 /NCGR_PEP_ID=MMETSP0043_2-20121206/31273_1 /TAXON_ID=464988 /ORGANISM="Hemiselmis andersenii, Strain CCMP644" /LENGTH=135 /DNA_ID=CAMNT_0001262309 /DNA_START=107 /DNA_END=510 /DNA_ORIENTATION=+
MVRSSSPARPRAALPVQHPSARSDWTAWAWDEADRAPSHTIAHALLHLPFAAQAGTWLRPESAGASENRADGEAGRTRVVSIRPRAAARHATATSVPAVLLVVAIALRLPARSGFQYFVRAGFRWGGGGVQPSPT